MSELDSRKEGTFGFINFEKRAYPRFSIDLCCEYWPVNSKKSSPCQMANISEGGLLLHLREKTEIGQKLRLSVFIDTGADYLPIEPVVQVVWKDLDLGEDSYRIGVKILEISASEMTTLRNFLSDLARKKSQTGGGRIPGKLLYDLGIEEMMIEPRFRTKRTDFY